MKSRRTFIRNTSILGTALLSGQWSSKAMGKLLAKPPENIDIDNIVENEDYWKQIAGIFNPTKSFINLENGYFSQQPLTTCQFFNDKTSEINNKSSFYMRNEMEAAIKSAKSSIAGFAGISTEEFVITRNTTESLDTIIHGYPWKKNDEVILSLQDYGSMQAAFEQEERRHGIKRKFVKIPLNPSSDDELVTLYENAITGKTKMILLTHMINITGQIIPVAKIIEMAHARGVEVMLDAAHSFAHINFSIKNINPDYLGTSLHKWLCCPLGLGLMYIKREHIGKIWPLFGDNGYAITDIRKFEHHGTRPMASIAAIEKAIAFHKMIGTELKEARLKYLKEYWLIKALNFKGINSNTPKDYSRSAAIANISMEGLTPEAFQKLLFENHKIFTVAIDTEEVKGIRITPHLFTLKTDLDKLVSALGEISKG